MDVLYDFERLEELVGVLDPHANLRVSVLAENVRRLVVWEIIYVLYNVILEGLVDQSDITNVLEFWIVLDLFIVGKLLEISLLYQSFEHKCVVQQQLFLEDFF